MVQISIIIPFFNRVTTLPRAINSVLAQNYTDFEIICVDDGSIDLSASYIMQIADPRIHLIQHGVNKGAAAARNTGVKAAKGQWIAFLDSDDEWSPHKLASQFASVLEQNVDIGFTDCAFEKNGVMSDYHHKAPVSQKKWFIHFLDGCYVSPGATMIIRRDVWNIIGGLDENLTRLEDWDFLIRASLKGAKFYHTPQILATVHLGDGWPKAEVIELACQKILAKHAGSILARGGKSALRIFEASTHLEIAASYIRNKNYPLGIIHMLCVLQSPARFMRWLKR